jgi:transcriptional regulator with XRE-family HTH domain
LVDFASRRDYSFYQEFVYISLGREFMANGPPVAPFGAWLKFWRKKRRLTQAQLAERAGNICTDSYISALERVKGPGKKGHTTRASEQIIEALAKALNAPIAEARLAAGYSATRPASNSTAVATVEPAPSGAGTKAEVMRQALSLPRAERIQVARSILEFEGIRLERNETIALPTEVAKEPPEADDISKS